VAFFYCEDGVAHQLATDLRLLGHVATVAALQGKRGAFDEAHLWYAAERQWTLITHNVADFQMLHRAWLLWQVTRPHAGILIIPQIPTGGAGPMALAIDSLTHSTLSLTNTLHRWEDGKGWQPHP
jgi:hypothetical protein